VEEMKLVWMCCAESYRVGFSEEILENIKKRKD
jgi:hypothetical protein